MGTGHIRRRLSCAAITVFGHRVASRMSQVGGQGAQLASWLARGDRSEARIEEARARLDRESAWMARHSVWEDIVRDIGNFLDTTPLDTPHPPSQKCAKLVSHKIRVGGHSGQIQG